MNGTKYPLFLFQLVYQIVNTDLQNKHLGGLLQMESELFPCPLQSVSLRRYLVRGSICTNGEEACKTRG